MRHLTTFLLVCYALQSKAAFDFSDIAFLQQQNNSSSNVVIVKTLAWYEGRNGGFTNDLSGNGHNLVDTSVGHILQTNQVNGYPAMLFPAASGSLLRSDITNAQPYTIFLVIRAMPDLGGGFPFETVNPQQQFRLGFFSINAGSDLNGGTLFPTNAFSYITCTYSNSLSYIRQNGVDIANGSPGTGTIDSQSIGAVVPFDISVALWGFCTNLTRAEVTNIENLYIKSSVQLMIINLQALLDTNPNYTLAIMYEDSLFNVTRYILWQGVNALALPVPSAPYNGQVIRKNFRLEVWNTSDGSVTQVVPLSLITSVLGDQDYRYGNDFQLAGNNGDIISFQSLYTASTTPPLTGLAAWWVMADRVDPAMSIPIPSRIVPAEVLSKVSGTFPGTTSQSLEFRTGRVISCSNLNGSTGYIAEDMWIIFAKNANGGYSNGNMVSMNGVTCQTANTNATDITANGWAGTLNTGNNGSLIFYVLRIVGGDAYIYNLVDWTIVSHISGVPAAAFSTLITVGGTAAFYLMEVFFYQTVQPQPIADLINKYISDTYSDGMMPLPLVFPDTKPINTP